MTFTNHVEVLEMWENFGGYKDIVFQDLVSKEFIFVTILPRWECPLIKIGDKGYLKWMEVIAGQTTWYDRATDTMRKYAYSSDYLVKFIPERPHDEELIL